MSNPPVPTPPVPNASATARAVARRELTGAIVDAARRQLAEVGPAALSVRAVSRELGMASSAVYRYFATRDELLTALILIGYEELADVVEAAEAAVPRTDRTGRWLALTGAFRNWAREHPHDYALLYGSPVPGYAAPSDTIEPAVRVARLVLELVADGGPVHDRVPEPAARAIGANLREFAGARADDDAVYRGLAAWGGLLGAVTLELFGHLHNAVEDYDAWFAESMRRLAPVTVSGSAPQALRSQA